MTTATAIYALTIFVAAGCFGAKRAFQTIVLVIFFSSAFVAAIGFTALAILYIAVRYFW